MHILYQVNIRCVFMVKGRPKGCLTPEIRDRAACSDVQMGDIVYRVGRVEHDALSPMVFFVAAQKDTEHR